MATRFGDQSGGIVSVAVRLAKPLGRHFAGERRKDDDLPRVVPQVAEESGQYYYKVQVAKPTKEAQDDVSAKRLWDEFVKLSGIGV